MRAFLRETLGTLLLAVVIFFLLQATLQTSVVVGPSMEPNLRGGQRLIINKVIYIFQEPKRGDIIVFHPLNNHPGDFIKRIVALPSEDVEIKEGKVYINGSPLREPYIKEPPRYTIPERQIPEDNYFVLGDNRNNSNDSHNGWTVPRRNIVGKAWLSIWRPSEWGLVPHYSLP